MNHKKTSTKLSSFYANHPELTIEGAGHGYKYYGISNDQTLKPLREEIEKIIRPLIPGFDRFCNFTPEGRVRYLYDYGYEDYGISFIGVGYQPIKDLEK